MNISSVNPVAVPPAATSVKTPEDVSQRARVVEAVKVVNESNTLGENNELTYVLDRASGRTLTRVIDRKTQEVVLQIPTESVLRLAQQLKQNSCGG
jgi:flagellar protein FlaG